MQQLRLSLSRRVLIFGLGHRLALGSSAVLEHLGAFLC